MPVPAVPVSTAADPVAGANSSGAPKRQHPVTLKTLAGAVVIASTACAALVFGFRPAVGWEAWRASVLRSYTVMAGDHVLRLTV